MQMMSKKVITVFCICVFILLLQRFGFSSLGQSEIAKEIANANYCKVDNDCTMAGFPCPFGCGGSPYINKAESKKLQELVSSYFRAGGKECCANCGRTVSPVCGKGKCVPKICEVNKEYKAWEEGTCACPQGSVYADRRSEKGGTIFRCVQ